MDITPHKWLFLDLNSYFASVEQQVNPRLRGKPVIVVPVESDHTCAIAASYEAKAYGIKTGTNVGEAKRMCRGLICVLANHKHYVEYQQKILDEVINHVPINKIWSIDELSSRLPPRMRNTQEAIKAANAVKAGITKNVGSAIKCSIGVAPNSFLAKVATDMQKPDGLVILEPETMKERLCALALTDLPGINVRMEARLNKAGIRSIEDLWNISPKHARKVWGGVGGERFWYNLHGYDIPDQETSTSMVGHSRMLDSNLRGPDAAWTVARRLTIKAASRLRRKEFYARSFSLSVRTTDGEWWGMQARILPAQDNFTFVRTLDELWAAMVSELKPWRLKKVSVVMNDLLREGEITDDLFERKSTEVQHAQKKDSALTSVMDHINKKYGAESIRLGISPKTEAGFLGTKIAFSRVPEIEEFSE